LLVVFDSRTNNVKRFVQKLNMECLQVDESLVVNTPYVLITHTTGLGEIPDATIRFLEANHRNMVGVASSGNIVWGKNFGMAAKKISEIYHVPVIHIFELSGTQDDVEKFIQEVNRLV
jgi:protein involved in ribonucleotide reduction